MEQTANSFSRRRSQSLAPTKRIWSRVIMPVSKYKRLENGLDYAIDFFYQIQKMVELGYCICLNIPQTLTGAHDNFLQSIFSNDNQPIGKVKLTPSYSKTKFQAQVQKLISESINRIKNKEVVQQFIGDNQQAMNNRSILLPFVVMKQKIFDKEVHHNLNIIFNSYQYKRISAIDASQIVQSYIFTQNMNASITRFFYSKSAQKGAAYKISNECWLSQMRQKQKDAWRVQQRKENSCIILKVMYENKSFFTQTLNLIQYLQRFFQKEVAYIVVDWILDTTGRYYLIDMKEVKLVDPKPKYRVSKSLSQLLSTVTCCMCLQTCNQSEISKILTTKLIINFSGHLKRRGINLSFRINFKKLSNFSRVCDLCYNLVVAQTKLIELQKIMSQICNFKNQISDNCSNLSQSAIDSKTPEDIVSMYQWRFFFYLEDIKNFYAIFNQNLKPQSTDRIFLTLQINDSITSFELKPPFSNNLTTKIIKIEYIFSEKENITQFLHQAEVRIQIVIKNKSSKAIAQGCIHGIYDQGQGYKNQAFLQRKYKQILLFNQKSKYSILGMYIGLSQDGLKNTSTFQFTKSLGVMRPQNCILDCQSLPAQWMQIVYQNYSESISKQRSLRLISDDPSIDHKIQLQNAKDKATQRDGSAKKTRMYANNKKSSLFPQLSGGRSQKRPKLVL